MPEHALTDSHPVINSNLLYHIRHGDIHPRPDIKRFDGQTVYFTDGTAEAYDTVIVATGYQITFPFFEASFLDYTQSDVDLYLRMFHADHPSLAFMGLIQAQGCLWTLVEVQAQLLAHYIVFLNNLWT